MQIHRLTTVSPIPAHRPLIHTHHQATNLLTSDLWRLATFVTSVTVERYCPVQTTHHRHYRNRSRPYVNVIKTIKSVVPQYWRPRLKASLTLNLHHISGSVVRSAMDGVTVLFGYTAIISQQFNFTMFSGYSLPGHSLRHSAGRTNQCADFPLTQELLAAVYLGPPFSSFLCG